MPGDDGRHVRITTDANGKAVAIITDKDGKETTVQVEGMSEDQAKDIANIMNTQKARESYKDKRKEIFSGIAASLKSGKELTDEQKDLLDSLPEDFDTSSLEELGLSKEDIKKIDDAQYDTDAEDDSDDAENDDELENDTKGEGDENNEDETKKPVNPKKVWRKRKNKRTGKMSKSYYYVGKDTERKNNNESITKDEYLKRVQKYRERLDKWKQSRQSDESLVSYVTNLLEKQSSNCTALKNYILEKLNE